METPFLHPGPVAPEVDTLSERLRAAARGLLILAFGLLPLLFIPSIYLPFSAGKSLMVAVAVVAAVLLYLLAMLRDGSLTLRVPPVLGAIWAVVAVTFVSAAVSGDARDAIFGDAFDGYSAAFVLLLAAVMTVAAVFAADKRAVIRLYGVLIFSSLVITLFHLARLIFGPEQLSFGIFAGATASPLGSWNGLAIFYGLVVLISLIALQQLPLSRVGRYIAVAVALVSLLMLAIVNFSASWWVLAFVSGVAILNQLARDLWKKGGRPKGKESFDTFVLSLAILAVSVVFLAGGARVGSFVSERLGVSFIEVRPSLSATVDITRAVYEDNLLLGSGPNRFVDAWRLHKDPSINQTIFWNVPFDSGYSYLTTAFIHAGVLGIIAWAAFLFSFLWAGFRFLFGSADPDRFWYFIGLSSFAASLYFLVMSAVYVPPPGILLLMAVTVGVFIASYARSRPGPAVTFSAGKGKIHGLSLVVAAVLIISASGYGLYAVSAQAYGVYTFNKILAAAEGDDIDAVDDRIVGVFDSARNDAFARQIAFHQWSRLLFVLNVSEPGPAEREAFQRAAARGIEAGQLAVSLDPTDPLNHRILGQIYSVLAVVGVEGAADKAIESFDAAKRYDPRNPILPLLEAELALQQEDPEAARASAEAAVALKSNYTEALFFLAQLDINEGNVERAVSIVGGLTQLEPQNPARRYQLGILLAGSGRLEEAVTAFEQAVALDPQYANARYFLALSYAEQGRVEAAVEQLTIVRDLNEANAAVEAVIAELRENGSLAGSVVESSLVTDRDADPDSVTEDDLSSGLVTSSNPVPPAAGSGNSGGEVSAD